MSLMMGCFGIASVQAQTKTSAGIHQEIDFNVTPARMYAVLLDAKQFSAFSKDKAEIEALPGAAFKLFGGRIEGRNVELIPNQRIVQAWRPTTWHAGVYSIVRFELTVRGSGMRIAMDHTGFPQDQFEHLSEGWPLNYWEPLHTYLNA
jgi:activator of HSP90 ATPase